MKYVLEEATLNAKRRSPCGERGLKSLAFCPRNLRGGGRSPCGERGLKWKNAALLLKRSSRSPCGERGLKSSWGRRSSRRWRSLPVRGAWVEMRMVKRW